MSAPHFYLDDIDADRLRLTGDDARHAARALRIQPGEEITISDGRGRIARARVIAVTPQTVEAEVLDRRSISAEPPHVIVHPAVPKSGKLDLEVQKLTEVGVDAIRPWLAARSVPRWDARKAAKHGDRLRAIARAAAEQSRRAFLPEVTDPRDLGELATPAIVLHEEATARLHEALPAETPERIALVVGPEGGLTPDEVEALRARGAAVASLGPSILRTETATIVGATLVLGRYGKLG